jgi:multiple antibiotic resistance protein
MNWSEIATAAMTLLFVMDPLGNVPIFNAALARFEVRRRVLITVRELLFALAILLVFLFAGTAILDFLGLTQPSLSIAGGVLLFIIALRMIYPPPAGEGSGNAEEPFIVPLAMPLVAGPSTIAFVLLLSSSAPEKIWQWCTALVLAWAGTTVILAVSPYMLRVLGARGLRALERLMGMLLVLLATQMLLNGVREFVRSL